MKDQYVCDIGDYGKYALLRAFALAGVKVGINWYLTEDDGSSDGKFKDYLNKGDLRWYTPELFDALKRIKDKGDPTVADIERAGILPGACFYSEKLALDRTPVERKLQRKQWFENSLMELAGAELIFADPDNGLLEKDDASALNAEKYVLPHEIESLFRAGHNVVYYCQKGRRKYGPWSDYLSIMFERIDEAKPAILTYHKGTQRSYVFLIHEKDFQRYRKIIDTFNSRWYKLFSEEYTSKGDVTREVTGAPFVIKRKNGTEITIEKRADGRIQMKSSADPCTSIILDVDQFCGRLGL